MTSDDDGREQVDRRGFLADVGDGGCSSESRARSGLLSSIPRAPDASAAPRTPDEAIQKLLAGNRRFAASRLTSSGQNLSRLRAQHGREAGAVRRGVGVRRLASARRARVRSIDRSDLRGARRGQHRDAGDHREPRVRRGGARHPRSPRAGPYELRRREGSDEGGECAGTDQRSLSAPPRRRRSVRRRRRARRPRPTP